MNFDEYQRLARKTSRLSIGGPQSAIAPMLGLAGGTGKILAMYQRYLRDNIDLSSSRDLLRENLGELLWYLSMVATACDLSLEEIAELNLMRNRDLYQQTVTELPLFDSQFPPHERFPRHLVIEFCELEREGGNPKACMKVIDASPSPAEIDWPIDKACKALGFTLGQPLGDPLTDNSRRLDGYRFHDAIHLGFMAVLNWSPNTRSLLRLKRKSDPGTDEVEDGARAIFAEEGLAAVLSRLAKRRTGFMSEASVDGDVLEVAAAAAVGLEVEGVPAWLWRRGICQGFRAMRLLTENGGGYLDVDLNKRTLTYRKVLSE
jgi:hypothetical protein